MEKILSIYDSKKEKKRDPLFIEIDQIDLESYANFHETGEFIPIPDKIIGNKTIVDWFSINDISYWWLISAVIYPKFNEVVFFIDRFTTLLEETNPDKVIINGFFDKFEIITQLCKKQNVRIEFDKTRKLSFDMKNKMKRSVISKRYKKILKEKTEKRLGVYNKKKTIEQFPRNNYVLITGIDRRVILTDIHGKNVKQDFILQPFIDLLVKNGFTPLCFDLDYTLKGSTNSLEERLASNLNWIPIEYLISRKKNESVKEKINHLQTSFQKMKDHDLDSIFNYKKINLWNFLKPSFDLIFLEPYLPTLIHLIEQLEEFFEKSKPDAIIQVYEAGSYAKTFEIAASKFGIKTIGIQHGAMINETQHDYMQKNTRSIENPLGNPIPDQTFVFGEYYKKMLVEKGGYPQDKVIITGNPTWNQIPLIRQQLNKGKIFKERDINEQKKIILVPLSFRIEYAKKNYSDRLILEKLYELFGKDDDKVIIVRPHPGDQFTQTVLNNLFPNSNFVCSTGSLYEDLFISDLVLVTYSTVGLEAALFDKPVLYVNMDKTRKSELYGKIPYMLINNKMAIESSMAELNRSVNSALSNSTQFILTSTEKDEFLDFLLNYKKKVDLLNIIFDNDGVIQNG